MNEQLFDYILMLNREGYQVTFDPYPWLPNAIKIRLRKSSFISEHIFRIDDFESYDAERDSVIICKLSDMKAEFEHDMRLRSKMKGENNDN